MVKNGYRRSKNLYNLWEVKQKGFDRLVQVAKERNLDDLSRLFKISSVDITY